jgi:hypothetical protein
MTNIRDRFHAWTLRGAALVALGVLVAGCETPPPKVTEAPKNPNAANEPVEKIGPMVPKKGAPEVKSIKSKAGGEDVPQ